MVHVGDQFKFVPYTDGCLRAQIVSVTRVSAGNVPGYGLLNPVDAPRDKQHDELTLEDWRNKIRSMR